LDSTIIKQQTKQMADITLKPEQTYTITLTGNEIKMLTEAIQELPAKYANPLMNKISLQLSETDANQDNK
jgi:hypothetical protein